MQRSYIDNLRTRGNWSLYVIRCQDSHYYVGICKTANLNYRLQEHFGKRTRFSGSQFCKRHPAELIIYKRHFQNKTGFEISEFYERFLTDYLKYLFGDERVGGYIYD